MHLHRMRDPILFGFFVSLRDDSVEAVFAQMCFANRSSDADFECSGCLKVYDGDEGKRSREWSRREKVLSVLE